MLEEAAVLGDEVSVGAGALVKARVKIYPSKTVEAGAIVTHSIVQGAPGVPEPVRRTWRVGSRERRHHSYDRGPPGDGLRDDPQARECRGDRPRREQIGPNPQAGP